MFTLDFWQALGLIGTGASVLGLWLTFAAKYNGDATRALTRDLVNALAAQTARQHEDTKTLLSRMDQAAEDRQRETRELIQALGGRP